MAYCICFHEEAIHFFLHYQMLEPGVPSLGGYNVYRCEGLTHKGNPCKCKSLQISPFVTSLEREAHRESKNKKDVENKAGVQGKAEQEAIRPEEEVL